MTIERSTELDGRVAVLTLTNPAARNAIDDQTRWDLLASLESSLADPTTRAVILAGAGGTFSSGGDLASMPTEEPRIRKRMGELHDIVRMIVGGTVPVIAAVDGMAYGSGMSLSAACDLVVASPDATFGCTFGRVGLIPDVGLMWSLPRRVGATRARRIFLRGQVLTAQQGAELGLVDVLAEGPALASAVAVAAELVSAVPDVIQTAKLRGADSSGLEETLAFELERQIELLASHAFADKRAEFLNRSIRRRSG